MRTLVLLFVASCCGSAQTADAALTFDVASVKVAGDAGSVSISVRKSEVGPAPASGDPIRFSRPRATLESLIQSAYSLKPQHVICPDWLKSERYAIEAKVPNGATQAQQMVMLRNLLAERFRLKVHPETREMPVYEMTIAKGGLKWKQSIADSHALRTLNPDGPFQLSSRSGANMVVIREQGTMEALAAKLSRLVDRPIVDRTSLAGNYDVIMSWMPDPVSSPGDAASAVPDATVPGTNLFAALESEAGLKLVSKKGKVEVLVVDHAEKTPTEN